MEKDYTIGERFTLPSKGLIYSTKVNPEIELRSMTARDEMKRLSPTNTPLKTLADIIEGCIVNKPTIHVYDMAFGDYIFLLYKLRIVSYGADYPIIATCPHCGETMKATANLDDLATKPFNLEEFESLCTITLPKSGKEVTLNYRTPRMDEAIKAKAKEMKKKVRSTDELDFTPYAQLFYAINTVDGKKLSSVDFDYFFDELLALDQQKILNAVDKLDSYVGVEDSFTLTCTTCSADFTSFFRFGSEFFRPSNI